MEWAPGFSDDKQRVQTVLTAMCPAFLPVAIPASSGGSERSADLTAASLGAEEQLPRGAPTSFHTPGGGLGANFLQPYNFWVASGPSAHSYITGSFPSVNRQMQSELRISAHQRHQVRDTASRSPRGTAVRGQERGWGRGGQAGEHPPASTQGCLLEGALHTPGAPDAAGPGRSMGSCLLGRDRGGTLALPSPGLKGESESTKEPRAVTEGRGAFRNDLLSSPCFEGMFRIYFLFNFCGGKHDLPTYTVPQLPPLLSAPPPPGPGLRRLRPLRALAERIAAGERAAAPRVPDSVLCPKLEERGVRLSPGRAQTPLPFHIPGGPLPAGSSTPGVRPPPRAQPLRVVRFSIVPPAEPGGRARAVVPSSPWLLPEASEPIVCAFPHTQRFHPATTPTPQPPGKGRCPAQRRGRGVSSWAARACGRRAEGRDEFGGSMARGAGFRRWGSGAQPGRARGARA
ncbi:unnamed protein product [Rangifer tarandus platyrhynchus]|uniref:Uncharacterized protein n=1 Tax=Rangifer tarandus platyrhynchus TaxID=3082113 RepID=A0ABN8ZIB8_RANTA|nr:unnamed protein product [Rangifer tarandus platyrhynchus]